QKADSWSVPKPAPQFRHATDRRHASDGLASPCSPPSQAALYSGGCSWHPTHPWHSWHPWHPGTSTHATLPLMSTVPAVDAEIQPDVNTLADLPFHVMGRLPKPVTLGRCRGNHVIQLSSKETFERIRDLSLGFRALGVSRGDRVAIISESRPEWLLCDLSVL